MHLFFVQGRLVSSWLPFKPILLCGPFLPHSLYVHTGTGTYKQASRSLVIKRIAINDLTNSPYFITSS